MSLTELAWLSLAAYAVHMLEEFLLDWRGWARSVIGLPVEWHDFYVTNAVVVVLGLVQAALAPSLPLAPLAFAALMLINATFFHVLPVLRTGGRFSPGVATAVVFFYPVGVAVFVTASTSGHAGIGLMAAAFGIGAALMAFPIVLLKLRAQAYFQQA